MSITLLLVPVGSVTAGKPKLVKSRVVSVRYASPGDTAYEGGIGGVCTLNVTDPFTVCASVEPEYGETYVSVEIKDVSPLPVAGAIMQNEKGVANFCGKTERPVWILSVSEVQFWAGTGTCKGGSPSVATTGEAVFTFYREK